MPTHAAHSRWQRFARSCGRAWEHVLDLGLILWVARVPLAFVLLGLLILGTAAQAQDLFVELVGEEVRRIPLFLYLLVFVWAMPTHYAARLLLDTDDRFRAHVEQERREASARCLAAMEAWVPRALGLLPFLAVILASCTNDPPPVLSPSVGPDNAAVPSASHPYRPVLAGTANHGIGGKP